MANITTEMIRQYQHPRIKLELTTGGASDIIYEEEIKTNSFSYKAEAMGGGAFAPGGCTVSSCTFTINDTTGRLTSKFREDAEVIVYVGYGPTSATATYDRLCTVYVAEAKRGNYEIKVKCFDAFRRADKIKWTTYAFPMTVNQILNDAAYCSGFTSIVAPTSGGDIVVDLRDADGNQPKLDMTCRQAMMYALQISGNFGRMDNISNNLYCGWYRRDGEADVEVDTSWVFKCEVTDFSSYTGVQVYGQVPTGTTDRLYVLSDNPFLTSANCAAVQARLYDALVGFTVCSANIDVACNPTVFPGMVGRFNYLQSGVPRTALIPISSMNVKGSLVATYTGNGISADEMDDLRKTANEAAADVARSNMNGYGGNLATQDWVKDQLAGSGGGGSDGEWIQIPTIDTAGYMDIAGKLTAYKLIVTTADNVTVSSVYAEASGRGGTGLLRYAIYGGDYFIPNDENGSTLITIPMTFWTSSGFGVGYPCTVTVRLSKEAKNLIAFSGSTNNLYEFTYDGERYTKLWFPIYGSATNLTHGEESTTVSSIQGMATFPYGLVKVASEWKFVHTRQEFFSLASQSESS